MDVPQGVRMIPRYTIEVCQGMSIQAAINTAAAQIPAPSATNPWTILIHPGTYTEQITCASYVNLKGIGPSESVIIQQVDADVITLANNVELEWFVVRVTTPTLARTLIKDNGVACIAKIKVVTLEITTPAALAHRLFNFTAASAIAIIGCFWNIGGTGITIAINNETAAATILLLSNDGTLAINAFQIGSTIAGTWRGGNNRFAGTCGLFNVSLGDIILDNDAKVCTGANSRIGGTVFFNTQSGATITVAASDSLSIDAANLICDGVNDQVEIQAAIDACAALPNGGTVQLSEGTFNIAATITLKHRVNIVGAGGIGTTEILLAAGSNCDMMKYTATVDGQGLFDIKDLWLYGRKEGNPTGGHGIYFAQSGTNQIYDVNVERVFVHRVHGSGFYVERCWSVKFRDSLAEVCDSHGFYFRNASHVSLFSCYSAANGGNGYDVVLLSKSSLIDCHASDNTGSGFVSGSFYTGFSDCQSPGNTVDGFNVSGSYCEYAGCTANSNGGIGFNVLAASTYITFTDCQAITNTATGYSVANGAIFLTFEGCLALTNGGDGFFEYAYYSSFIGCTARQNTVYGFNFNGFYNSYSNNQAYNNTEHGYLVRSFYSTYSGCHARSTAAGKKSFYVDRDSNTFQGCWSDSDVFFSSVADNNKISDCQFATITGNSGVRNVWDLTLTSLTLDLSGAATDVEVYHAVNKGCLVGYYILYTEASSADAGVNIRVGRYQDGVALDDDYFDISTSEVSKNKGYAKFFSIVDLTQKAIIAGDTVTVGTAGGKTGTGEVKLVLLIAELCG